MNKSEQSERSVACEATDREWAAYRLGRNVTHLQWVMSFNVGDLVKDVATDTFHDARVWLDSHKEE